MELTGIELYKLRAARLAFRIASWAPQGLGYVKLSPDGSLYATDGVVMVRAEDAHDGRFSGALYVSPASRFTLSKTVERLELRVGDGSLVEHRPRSEEAHEVDVERDVHFPPVETLIPGHLAELQSPPHFDSIIGGRVAEAYGLDVGVWGASLVPLAVQLRNTDEGDTVVLAGVRREKA